MAEKENRRGKVEASVKKVTDAFADGKIKLEDGQFLTPYRTAVLIKDRERLDSLPSTGSVTEVFKRWADVGFAVFHGKPFAFKGYTAKGKELGLTEMKLRHTAKLRKANADAKASTNGEAKKPAAKKATKKAPAKKAPAAKKAAASKPDPIATGV